MARAAILIVGDEILGGHTQDTNSHYLAGRLAAHGIRLERIVTVADEVEAIAAEVEALARTQADFIFVCGGIGPTPDDRTYEAVAMAVGCPLVVRPEDEAWMRHRIQETGYGADLLEQPERAEGLWRMIRRPEGSLVILNPVGAALGSVVRLGTSRLFVLPGVPRELRAMMEQGIEPEYLAAHRPEHVVGELEIRGEEAPLYAVLRDLETRYPTVRLGSYPQDDRGRILLRAQGPAADVEAVLRRLEAAHGGPSRRIR